MKKIFAKIDYRLFLVVSVGNLLNTMLAFKQKQVPIPNSEFTRNSTISELFSYPTVWALILGGSLACFLVQFIYAYFKVKKNS